MLARKGPERHVPAETGLLRRRISASRGEGHDVWGVPAVRDGNGGGDSARASRGAGRGGGGRGGRRGRGRRAAARRRQGRRGHQRAGRLDRGLLEGGAADLPQGVVRGRGDGLWRIQADAVFAPGAELRIYAEPVGFGWKDENGAETTTFRTAIEIRNAKGLILAKSSAPAVLEKTSRSKSRDFHITVTFTLPDLKPGDYQLVLTVTDATTGKSAPIELPITIAGG